MNGTIWRTPALRVEQLEVAAGTRLRGHGHDVPHLCFLSRGGFEERDGGRRRRVSAGTLRSSPAGDEHDLVFEADSTCLLILVEGDPGLIAAKVPVRRWFVGNRRIGGLIQNLTETLLEDRSPSSFGMETLALELLATTQMHEPDASKPPEWLQRVKQSIRDSPGAPPAPTVMAAEVGYHPVYVARAFRHHFGIGLGQYARLVRAEYGRSLLSATDVPLARVAFRAGYSDQSHMTRQMVRFFGSTPAQVRRRAGRLVEVASVQDTRALRIDD